MIPKFNEYKERFELYSDDVIKPGLESIRAALLKVGNPEKRLNVIHVAGTNGKGSTIAFMESILREHGFSTGVFSSPALVDVHDQIRLNGFPINQDEMDKSFIEMKEAGLSGMLTDFELLTVAAFLTFKRNAPDYILLECGMGGKLDSTNVVTPLVSIITSIALDHVSFLGSTLEEITEQKAGIIKEERPVVIGMLPEVANKVIRNKAMEMNSELMVYGEDFKMVPNEVFEGGIRVAIPNRKLKGPHQAINASIAIEALWKAGVNLQEALVTKGVATTFLLYRFQEIAPGVFVDGAHNPAAAKMLAETIRTEFSDEKVDFVIGMLKTKDIRRTLDELIPVAHSFTFVDFDHPQAAKAEELMESCLFNKKRMTNHINDTIILSKENNRKRIVAGSLYLLNRLLA
ncbi:folylpolyglutamate synthase/dihydrofolate synthase family protein [Sporosarcina sp. FSL W8-0480]|uniref:bifunctional folylpolyglutamate synthase/dihydrofolate synthase n=1 Tax=Sporosarcina sp. FSL W8-0480 TaxID=2954701 RepID=UPI0030DB9D35